MNVEGGRVVVAVQNMSMEPALSKTSSISTRWMHDRERTGGFTAERVMSYANAMTLDSMTAFDREAPVMVPAKDVADEESQVVVKPERDNEELLEDWQSARPRVFDLRHRQLLEAGKSSVALNRRGSFEDQKCQVHFPYRS